MPCVCMYNRIQMTGNQCGYACRWLLWASRLLLCAAHGRCLFLRTLWPLSSGARGLSVETYPSSWRGAFVDARLGGCATTGCSTHTPAANLWDGENGRAGEWVPSLGLPGFLRMPEQSHGNRGRWTDGPVPRRRIQGLAASQTCSSRWSTSTHPSPRLKSRPKGQPKYNTCGARKTPCRGRSPYLGGNLQQERILIPLHGAAAICG